jgi:hypothetical protein
VRAAIPKSPCSACSYKVDPQLIPVRHRELFLETVKGVIRVDGEIADEELEHLELLEEMLFWEADAG